MHKLFFQYLPSQCVRRFSERKLSIELTRNVKSTVHNPVLTRDFIFESLYHKDHGYFSNISERLIFQATKAPILNIDQQLLDFSRIEDEVDYVECLHDLYSNGRHAWGTPVELYQPWYGRAIADYIINTRDADKPLIIYEIGGGNGTCALSVLNYLREYYTPIYDQSHYNIIEVSKALHEIQVERMQDAGHLHHFTSHNLSVTDWREVIEGEVFIIALEVMDNLPHDKVVIHNNPRAAHPITQTCVIPKVGTINSRGDQVYEEVNLPLEDPHIIRYMDYMNKIEHDRELMRSLEPIVLFDEKDTGYYEGMKDIRPFHGNLFLKALKRIADSAVETFNNSFTQGQTEYYIPTMQLMMLDVFNCYFPGHRLILADFDYLPEADKDPGIINAPCVQRKYRSLTPKLDTKKFMQLAKMKYMEGKSIDQTVRENSETTYVSKSFNSYLVPKGSCDIFFATDFKQLQIVYDRLTQGRRGSLVMKNKQFMEKWARCERTTTKSGYNPLLKDYGNFSFFLT
ncbi:NADH dehydrogenase [ubiquinone] complex I, assembly factor 7 [Acrasis kona]|uniref:Protein arginine methyltransferase NDUFAF7 n=1 Tax=Acrasis kona TaxID=1008807 RepID=A0AAW2Z9A3_9EUKA